MKKKSTEVAEELVISPPNLCEIELQIRGTSPFVQHKFSEKAKRMMADKKAGLIKNTRKRDALDLDEECEAAMHRLEDGSPGIPCSSFRAAAISACRLVGHPMTMAKLSIFIKADGLDRDEGVPLVRIKGKHERHIEHVRLATGVADVSIRPMWREWSCKVRVLFDADQFTAQSVVNLMSRAGMQVGVGEGRPDSKKSAGCGWGTFEVVS